MAPLQKNERRLIYALIGILLFVANAGVWSYILRNRTQLQTENKNALLKLNQAKVILQDKNTWLKRKEWVKSKQPFFENNAPGKMLEELQKNIQDLPLDITRQQLIEPSQNQDLTEIATQLTLEGELEPLLKWVTSVPDPENFRFIKRLSLKMSERSEKMALDIVVAARGQSSIPVKVKK